jgi:hypothetical protein
MTEEENLIIKELIQLTLTYDVSRVDKGWAPLDPTYITGKIATPNYIVVWHFDKATCSGSLGLYGDKRNPYLGQSGLINICYYNKENFFVEKEKMAVGCNDYNCFLEIFRKFDQIKKKMTQQTIADLEFNHTFSLDCYQLNYDKFKSLNPNTWNRKIIPGINIFNINLPEPSRHEINTKVDNIKTVLELFDMLDVIIGEQMTGASLKVNNDLFTILPNSKDLCFSKFEKVNDNEFNMILKYAE